MFERPGESKGLADCFWKHTPPRTDTCTLAAGAIHPDAESKGLWAILSGIALAVRFAMGLIDYRVF